MTENSKATPTKKTIQDPPEYAAATEATPSSSLDKMPPWSIPGAESVAGGSGAGGEKRNVPQVDQEWARSRQTHPAVAAAIHAIADGVRTPETICENPTEAEKDKVRTTVDEYIRNGDFPAEPGGRYAWGSNSYAWGSNSPG